MMARSSWSFLIADATVNLVTVLIVLAIIALIVFIFTRLR